MRVTAFCLLHGKWHDPSCWDELAGHLRAAGDSVVAPDLRLNDPKTTYGDRAQPALDAIGDERTVIVAHSLAAAYAPLIAVERPDSFVVYLCPPPVLPLRVDSAPPGIRADFPFPELTPEGLSIWEPEAAIVAMYSRLPPERARAAAARLRPDVPAADEYPLSDHPQIATALVYAAEDELIEPDWCRYAAREVLGVEPVELPGGHFPMLVDAPALAALLRDLPAR